MILPNAAQAYLLDWDTVDWSAGGLSQTFINVDGSGIDVTITLTLNNMVFQPINDPAIPGSSNPQPDDNRRYGGDGGTSAYNAGEYVDSNGNPSPESLHFHVNGTSNNGQSYLNVVISFSHAVTGVDFRLFDVDRGGESETNPFARSFEDAVELVGGSLGGTAVAAPTASYQGSGIAVETTPSGPRYYGTTGSADMPNAVLGFGWETQVVDEVGFRYTAGSRSRSDPGNQGISLSDIRFFAAVPEPGTVAGGVILALFMGLGVVRRGLRFRGRARA